MFGVSSAAGLVTLTVLGLAGVFATIMVTHTMAWGVEWKLWVQAAFPAEYHSALGMFPLWLVLAELLVVLAMASPIALRICR